VPPPPTASAEDVRPTRRGLLLGGLRIGAGGLAGVLLAGCSDGAGAPGSGSTTGSTSPAVGTTEPAKAADEDLLASVLRQMATTRALVGAVRRRHRDLSATLAPLGSAHATHGRALGGLPAADRTSPPARDGAAALAQVVTAEQRLVDEVSGAVVAARSGALAAVLASVAASLTQHVAALAEVSLPPVTTGTAP